MIAQQFDAVLPAVATSDAQVQTDSQANEYARLAILLQASYSTLLRMERVGDFLDNFQPSVPFMSQRHCQIMGKIDNHFLQSKGDDIDPAIIGFIANDVNMFSLNRFDKVRVNLMNLEIHRMERGYERKRLREGELSVAEQRQMVCRVCYGQINPGVSLNFGKCGHLTCATCTMQILNTRDLMNRCGDCLRAIGGENDMLTVKFKFNAKLHAVCRFCYKPFNDDGSIIKRGQCGHVYHEACMVYNMNRCMKCSAEISDGGIRLFVYWR